MFPWEKEAQFENRQKNSEAGRVRWSRWRSRHSEEDRERIRKYAAENPDYLQKWRKENPDKVKEYSQRQNDTEERRTYMREYMREYRKAKQESENGKNKKPVGRPKKNKS